MTSEGQSSAAGKAAASSHSSTTGRAAASSAQLNMACRPQTKDVGSLAHNEFHAGFLDSMGRPLEKLFRSWARYFQIEYLLT